MSYFQLSAVCAAVALASAAVAASVPAANERSASQAGWHPVLAREAEPGDDHHQGKGRLSDDTPTTTAREAGEPRGEGPGHPVSDQMPATIAREAGEPRGEGPGHPVRDEQPAGVLA